MLFVYLIIVVGVYVMDSKKLQDSIDILAPQGKFDELDKMADKNSNLAHLCAFAAGIGIFIIMFSSYRFIQ